MKSPPLEVFGCSVSAICAGCCGGPARALHLAWLPCRPAELPTCFTVQLNFSICPCMHRLNTCWLLNPLKTFAAHGVKGSWSLDSTFGQFLTLQLNTLYKIHILSNTIPSPILFQIFLQRGKNIRCRPPVSHSWGVGDLELDLPLRSRSQIFTSASDPVKGWASWVPTSCTGLQGRPGHRGSETLKSLPSCRLQELTLTDCLSYSAFPMMPYCEHVVSPPHCLPLAMLYYKLALFFFL